MLSRRETEVFLYLLRETGPLKGFEIAGHFHVTERTVRNDIREINQFLSEYGLQVSADRNRGYWFDEETKLAIQSRHILRENIDDFSYELPQTSNERVVYLLFNMCFGNDYSVDEIEELFYISRSAAISDIAKLERLLNKKLLMKLTLRENRYCIDEKESLIRSAVSGIYTQRRNDLLELKYSHFITGDESFWNVLSVLSEMITEFCEVMDFRLSGDSIYSFAVDIALTYQRVSQGYPIEDMGRGISKTGEALKKVMLTKDPGFGILSENDYVYLERRLYTKDYLENDPVPLSEPVKTAIRNFEKLLNRFDYSLDHSSGEIEHQIQKLVLRFRYGYYFNVPEKREICSQMPVYFYFAQVLKYFIEKENPDIRIRLSGLSILTLLLKKEMKMPEKHVILVTDANPWMARETEKRIFTEFSDELECSAIVSRYDYEMNQEQADLVISTEPLGSHTDHVLVHRLTDRDDLERIRRKLVAPESRETDIREDSEAVSFESGVLELLRSLFNEKKIGCPDFEWLERNLYDIMVCCLAGDVLRITFPLISSNRMKVYGLELREPYVYAAKEYRKLEIYSFSLYETARMNAYFKSQD